MPFKSKAQARFMYAVENDPELAKKKHVPQSVAKDFIDASKGKSLKKLPEKKRLTKTEETIRNINK